MKKYVVYSNTGLSSRQLGLTAEYLEKCTKEGVELKIVNCNNVLENCYFNPLHNTLACASCQSRSMELYKQIGIPKENFISLTTLYFEVEFPFFENLSELLKFEYQGINVGRGAASSIISYYRNSYISSHTHKEIIELECKKAINVLLNFKNVLKKEAPDKVILFNGRFAEIFPVLEYCVQIGLDYTAIESGTKNSYELYDNSLPHSIVFMHDSMMEMWKNETNKERKYKIAHDWYQKKRNKDDSIEISFTKNQKLDALPKGFDTSKKNILILNSSEDEMKVVEEFETELYDTQNEAINTVLTHFIGNDDFHFYLRIHPNLGEVSNVQVEEIEEMSYSNLTVIGPNEPIDTYALIDACDQSMGFGSTAIIEGTYWGNVSILLGKAFYYYLEESCYKPQTFEELFDLIKTPNLPPKPKEACLPYGYYYSLFGNKTESFVYNGLSDSTFKGKKIKKWYPSTLLYLFRYLFQSKKWATAYRAVIGKKWKLPDFFRYKI
jgi:hypothetical protein